MSIIYVGISNSHPYIWKFIDRYRYDREIDHKVTCIKITT